MKYKLVPVEPTREMWAAAGDAVIALRSQHHDAISGAVYKAMLAAAPVFEHSPVGYADQDDLDWDDDVIIRKEPRHSYTVPLYRHPQPAPDTAKFIRLLDIARSSVDYQMCAQNQNHEAGRKHYANFQKLLAEIETVIIDYHEQKGQQLTASLAYDAATHLTNWLDMDLCECEGSHTCGYTEVRRTRDALLNVAAQQSGGNL